jgi:hypothetical protein
MFNQSIVRKVMLLGVMLLFLATLSFSSGAKSAVANNAEAFSPCSVCRMACRQEYLACIRSGQLGCEEVAADCFAGCPCPKP